MRAGILPPLLALLAAGCGDEPLLHGLAERDAAAVLVALDEAGIPAAKAAGDGPDAGWTVTVAAADAGRAHRVLAARELPRPRAPGLAELLGQSGLVSTPAEEQARLRHALAGELSRSIEALDGVVEARVHLGVPAEDPLRPGARPRPHASVLVKCSAGGCPAVRGLEDGLRRLVAGAAEGLEPDAVAVVVAEAAAGPPAPAPRRRSPLLLCLAALLVLAAAAAAAIAWRARRAEGEP